MKNFRIPPGVDRRLNALRTGTHSHEPVLPGEDPEEIARDAEEMLAALKPTCVVAAEMAKAAIRNRLQAKRCRRGTDLMLQNHPVARAIGNLQRTKSIADEEAVRQLIQLPYDGLEKLGAFVESASAEQKADIKFIKQIAANTKQIAGQINALVQYFLGMGELFSKEQDRTLQLDVLFMKQWQAIRFAEEINAEHQRLLSSKGLSHLNQPSANQPRAIDGEDKKFEVVESVEVSSPGEENVV